MVFLAFFLILQPVVSKKHRNTFRTTLGACAEEKGSTTRASLTRRLGTFSKWNKSRDFWRACRPGIVPRQHVSSVARSSFCEDFVGEMEKYFCSFCVCMPGNKLSTMSRSLSSFLESFYFF